MKKYIVTYKFSDETLYSELVEATNEIYAVDIIKKTRKDAVIIEVEKLKE